MADNEKMVLTKGSSDQTKAALAMNNSIMSATKLTAAQANLKRSVESVGAKSTTTTKKAAEAQVNSTRLTASGMAKSTMATKKAASAQASSTMAAASAVARAKMSQQKSNAMHGRIKQATA